MRRKKEEKSPELQSASAEEEAILRDVITVNYSTFQCAPTAAGGSERHVQVHSARAAPNCLLLGMNEPSARDQSIH